MSTNPNLPGQDSDPSVASITMQPLSRRRRWGLGALVVAVVALAVMSFLPSPYVIQKPGPTYNTLGEVVLADGESAPLISIDGAETYPAQGSLWLTTVLVNGNRERSVPWTELIGAWFDPARAVLPVDAVFPQGVTSAERSERNNALMVDSQTEATAAALLAMGYDLAAEISVVEVVAGSPADSQVLPGDRLLRANGQALPAASSLRSIIQEGGGDPIELTIWRNGEELKKTITPELQRDSAGNDVWLIGIALTAAYEFPFEVTIQLENVGGPSAGLMFALGIMDLLTPGDMTGGVDVAGTGTISSDGTVGLIGGARQKIFAAADTGARYFLLPTQTCSQVGGAAPKGIRAVPVNTLDEAVDALEIIARGDSADVLPSCPAG